MDLYKCTIMYLALTLAADVPSVQCAIVHYWDVRPFFPNKIRIPFSFAYFVHYSFHVTLPSMIILSLAYSKVENSKTEFDKACQQAMSEHCILKEVKLKGKIIIMKDMLLANNMQIRFLQSRDHWANQKSSSRNQILQKLYVEKSLYLQSTKLRTQ